MVGRDIGARLVWIPSGTLQTTFPAAGSCLSRDILKYLVAGNSKSANGAMVNLLKSLPKNLIDFFSRQHSLLAEARVLVPPEEPLQEEVAVHLLRKQIRGRVDFEEALPEDGQVPQ